MLRSRTRVDLKCHPHLLTAPPLFVVPLQVFAPSSPSPVPQAHLRAIPALALAQGLVLSLGVPHYFPPQPQPLQFAPARPLAQVQQQQKVSNALYSMHPSPRQTRLTRV